MKCIIYQITCNITNDVYVGSTVNFKNRMYHHKELNCSSSSIIERGHFTTLILEEFEFNNKLERFKKEQEYIDKIECINKNNAYTNKDEYNKEYNYNYYHKHKDEKRKIKKITDKDYYEKSKDRLLKKVLCECSKEVVYCGMSRHLKTAFHLSFVNS